MSTTFYLGILIVYAIAMIVIGFALRKQANKSMDDYGLASNRFGLLVVSIVSIGSWVGSGGLLGLSTGGYTEGVMGYWEYAMGYICILPFVFLFLTRVKFLKLYTVPDFFALRYAKYNEAVRYPTGAFYLIRNATSLGMQFNALAFLFTAFFDWSHAMGVWVSALIVVVYTAMSGFLSVMITNLIQSIFQTITPFVALGFVIYAAGGWDKITGYYANAGLSTNLSLFNGTDWIIDVIYYAFTVGLFFIMADQGDWQRVASAKDAKTAKRSMWIGTLAVLPILVIPCYVGAAARVVLGENADSDMVFYELIKITGPVVAIILLVGALSTIMSCTSSYLFAGGMNVSHDIIVHFLKSRGKEITEKQELFYSKVGIVICCLIGVFFAIKIEGILTLWTAGLSICIAGMVVPFICAWFTKKVNTEAALASMVLGGGVALVWTFLENPYGLDAIWVGLPLSILCCLIVPLFTAPPTKEEQQNTYYFNSKFKNIK